MTTMGWKCPNCGKAHAPTVQTCPEAPSGWAPSWHPWATPINQPVFQPAYVHSADPPAAWPT